MSLGGHVCKRYKDCFDIYYLNSFDTRCLVFCLANRLGQVVNSSETREAGNAWEIFVTGPVSDGN